MPDLEKPSRSIPSLDGLRALSILMVLGLHSMQAVQDTHPFSRMAYVIANGNLGVRIFFVISGYLITRLLLREWETKGAISLSRFYVRRAFRILPPLYLYLGVLCALVLAGHLVLPWSEVVEAALFVRNYSPHADTWALEHTWSLCIEEQFYLLWPAVLVWSLVRKKREVAIRFAVIAVILIPIVRTVFTAKRVPYLHGISMFHMNADTILFGCLAALLEGHAAAERLYERVMSWPWLAPVLVYLVSGYATIRWQNYYSFPLGTTLDAFLMACTLVWCVRNPDTLAGRVLNWAPLRWMGVLSYSIYLWQTLFLHEKNRSVFGGAHWYNTTPGNLLAILLAAVASFYLVERPALRVRDAIVRRRIPVR